MDFHISWRQHTKGSIHSSTMVLRFSIRWCSAKTSRYLRAFLEVIIDNFSFIVLTSFTIQFRLLALFVLMIIYFTLNFFLSLFFFFILTNLIQEARSQHRHSSGPVQFAIQDSTVLHRSSCYGLLQQPHHLTINNQQSCAQSTAWLVAQPQKWQHQPSSQSDSVQG